MKPSLKLKILIIITILMMAFIFFQSSLPADLSSKESDFLVPVVSRTLNIKPDDASFLIRKCAHFIEYLILGIFIALSVSEMIKYRKNPVRHFKSLAFAVSWASGTLYSVSDEIHQSFVPGRSCELRDVIIDSCGIAAGVLIITAIYRKRPWKNDSAA